MPPPEPKSFAFARDLATSHFDIAGADLLIGGIPVRELAARYGTPLFIYDGGVMRRSYRSARRSAVRLRQDSLLGQGQPDRGDHPPVLR